LARNELENWGRWWRYREARECDQGGTSVSAILMEICALGVRVQTTNTNSHHHLSESIRVPGSVADMDERVETLALPYRNALVLRYVRRNMRRLGSLPLLRAELTIGEMLIAEWGSVPDWATSDQRKGWVRR
jgi:hypothetical protein